jgi:hypothetical protein
MAPQSTKVWPKVVPPLADAVSLVDGEQRNRRWIEFSGKTGHPFRGDVQQLHMTMSGPIPDGTLKFWLLSATEIGGGHPSAAQGPDLVLHEGYQG